MPNINTSVDDLLLKSDRRCDFTNGSSKQVPLTADPIETGPNISDDSEVCADSLNDTESISSSLHQEYRGHSTTTKEAGSKLNPNCEPFVPIGSLEQASTSTSSGYGDCDVKPFNPKEFQEKLCCFACGRPGHISRNCLHRPTEFFYGKNQKVTPKAKPTVKSMRTDQSSKPRVTPQKVPHKPSTAKKAKSVKQNQSGFQKQKSKVFKTKNKSQWKNNPPTKPPLKPVDHGSGARPKIVNAKLVKPKGVIKKGPIIPPVPKPIMVWVPIFH
ncbi:hypothetical protein R6Q57_014208 [Mikania cordata]